MDDKKLAILLLVIAILLLGFSVYANGAGAFDSLADPLVGEGLGVMCDNEEDCRAFCSNNRGQCDIYCEENRGNELCGRLFGSTGR